MFEWCWCVEVVVIFFNDYFDFLCWVMLLLVGLVDEFVVFDFELI